MESSLYSISRMTVLIPEIKQLWGSSSIVTLTPLLGQWIITWSGQATSTTMGPQQRHTSIYLTSNKKGRRPYRTTSQIWNAEGASKRSTDITTHEIEEVLKTWQSVHLSRHTGSNNQMRSRPRITTHLHRSLLNCHSRPPTTGKNHHITILQLQRYRLGQLQEEPLTKTKKTL